jgi:predicted metal-dependent hydrolase
VGWLHSSRGADIALQHTCWGSCSIATYCSITLKRWLRHLSPFTFDYASLG